MSRVTSNSPNCSGRYSRVNSSVPTPLAGHFQALLRPGLARKSMRLGSEPASAPVDGRETSFSDPRPGPVGTRARAAARQVTELVAIPLSSGVGSGSSWVSAIHNPGRRPDCVADRAVSSPSDTAFGPPPTPKFGPCSPRAKLIVPDREWSDWLGMTLGDTLQDGS